MKRIIEKFAELQSLVLPEAPVDGPGAERVRQLRFEVPISLLAHFDRRIACGRKAVAVVRNGVCGECHMRLPFGLAAALASAEDVQRCEHCGSFLLVTAEDKELQRKAQEEIRGKRVRMMRRALARVDA
jgi:DNA-directed RNA polymerase subunit RPC12/RpoP